MNTKKELEQFYQKRQEIFSKKFELYAQKTRNTNLARGIIFLAISILSIIFTNYNLNITITIIIVGLILFGIQIKKGLKYQNLKSYYKELKEINQKEIESLNNNNSSFKDGKEFINNSHPYSYDLDIFGNNSIFQKLNRTTTSFGYNLLGKRLSQPFKDITEITKIQKAVELLKNNVEERQNFGAAGNMILNDINENDVKNLKNYTKTFTNNKKWEIIAKILIAITIISLILCLFNVINFLLPTLLYVTNYLITMFVSKHTNKLSEKISKRDTIFEKYQQLFSIIEKLEQKPQYLELMAQQSTTNGKISNELKEIKKIAKLYDIRLNFLLNIFLEGLFLYDILINIKFEKYLSKNANNTEIWFKIIAEYDYLFSLSNLSFNNPEWCMPNPHGHDFQLNATNAGHPLLSKEKCIKNDINFSNCPYIIIITGANMAGKSTYLRTIGVNLVLAQIGAAVCAESFIFQPVELYTSIRNNDSIQNSESYFFAELKRLQNIVTKLKTNQKLFIIVDEMLRGTNSKDKHDGSAKFLQKVLKYNCYGVFATHDIDLGYMKEILPQNINTQCFEISFNNDNLIFDYKLKDGISKNLNASYLMKKIGIID